MQLFDVIFEKLISNSENMFLVDEIMEREYLYGTFIEIAIIKMMKIYK